MAILRDHAHAKSCRTCPLLSWGGQAQEDQHCHHPDAGDELSFMDNIENVPETCPLRKLDLIITIHDPYAKRPEK